MILKRGAPAPRYIYNMSAQNRAARSEKHGAINNRGAPRKRGAPGTCPKCLPLNPPLLACRYFIKQIPNGFSCFLMCLRFLKVSRHPARSDHNIPRVRITTSRAFGSQHHAWSDHDIPRVRITTSRVFGSQPLACSDHNRDVVIYDITRPSKR